MTLIKHEKKRLLFVIKVTGFLVNKVTGFLVNFPYTYITKKLNRNKKKIALHYLVRNKEACLRDTGVYLFNLFIREEPDEKKLSCPVL